MLDKTDIEKIDKIDKDFMLIHGTFTSMDSKPYALFMKFEDSSMKDGSVPKMYKELIAVGISVFHNCEPCMVWHIREALKSGATDRQILETIEVASQMGGGPVVARSSFPFKVMEYMMGKGK